MVATDAKGRESEGAAIPTQMTLNWKPRFSNFFSIWLVMLSKPTWLLGKTDGPPALMVAAAIGIGDVGGVWLLNE